METSNLQQNQFQAKVGKIYNNIYRAFSETTLENRCPEIIQQKHCININGDPNGHHMAGCISKHEVSMANVHLRLHFNNHPWKVRVNCE